MRHFLRRFRCLLGKTVFLILLLTVHDRSQAHSILVESIPAQGAKLSTAPSTAQLRFNSMIEPGLTRVSLVQGRQRTALKVGKESVIDRIIMPLPPLGPGVYSIVYKVLALDGHVTKGSVQFTILPPGTAP